MRSENTAAPIGAPRPELFIWTLISEARYGVFHNFLSRIPTLEIQSALIEEFPNRRDYANNALTNSTRSYTHVLSFFFPFTRLGQFRAIAPRAFNRCAILTSIFNKRETFRARSKYGCHLSRFVRFAPQTFELNYML